MYSMYYVYILRSVPRPEKTYTGLTNNLKLRLQQHNAGQTSYTRRFKPWQIAFYAAFPARQPAELFETYLKSGSGRLFAERHLLLSTTTPAPATPGSPGAHAFPND